MIRKCINLALNAVAFMAVITAFLPLLSWKRLEGVPVPSHFDIHGVVDGVGGRGVLLTLALLALGMFILMVLAQFFPQLVSLPVPKNRSAIAKKVKRDLAAQLNLLMAFFFSFCANSSLSVAAGKTQALSMWVVWVIVALALLCIGAALFRLFRR